MPKSRKDVESALKSKGFQKTEGDHHFFIYFTKKGKKTLAKTKTSHSMRDISDDLLSQMARQCKLTKSQFLELVDCPMNRDKFEEALSKIGQI